MNKSIYLVAIAFIAILTGCNEQRFIKEKDGTEYKIIRNSNGRKAVAGDWMQVNVIQKYKDSLLYSSHDASAPRFIPFDTMQMPPFFRDVHEGDSLVIRESTDSIIKMGQAPPFMKKGQYVFQAFKIAKLYKSKEEADNAAKPFEAGAKAYNYKKAVESIDKEIADNDSLAKADDKMITNFMAKNNLKGSKTKWGTYVVIETPGTGAALTQNDVVEVNYTGRTFNDSTFDSNTDQKFGHVEPLYVDLGEFRGIIPGWVDGLRMMQKGTKGKLIIPSYLAYGASGRPPKINPNENLVFDMEVTNVITQDQYKAIMQKQQEEMMKQRQMMQQQMQQMQKPKGK